MTELVRRLLPWGAGGAFGACVANAVWLACLIFLETRGPVSLQAAEYPGLFRLSVGSALLLTFMQVPVGVTTAALVAQREPARALIGGFFYVLYIPINMISYFTYGRMAPLVHGPISGEEGAGLVARLIEIGDPLALFGTLPVLGYGLLGLAWCILAPSFWSLGRRDWQVTTALIFLSGFLSVLGGIGAYIDVEWLTRLCLIGGVVSFPALAMLGVSMWRERGSAA